MVSSEIEEMGKGRTYTAPRQDLSPVIVPFLNKLPQKHQLEF